MPLLSPSQIHEVLRKETRATNPESQPLEKLLNKSNLSKEEVLDQVSFLMRCAEQDNTKLAAAKLGLELNGLLEDEQVKPMQVTIIINDSQFTNLNPILIPR